MTPSDYSNGHSLEHDRMQADVLEWLREHGTKKITATHKGEKIELERYGPWAEVSLVIDGNIRGFVDILERWAPVVPEGKQSSPSKLRRMVAYEIKPKLTTVGGLIRQMRAEELLLEKWASGDSPWDLYVNTIPVVNHDDPELPLLRRLWAGPVALWNAQERTLG